MTQVSIPVGFGYIHCKGYGCKPIRTIRYDSTRRRLSISKAVVPKTGPLSLTTSELDHSKTNKSELKRQKSNLKRRFGKLQIQTLDTIKEEDLEFSKLKTAHDFNKSVSLPNIDLNSGGYLLHRDSTWNFPFIYSRYWMPNATLTKKVPAQKEHIPPRVSVSSESKHRLRGSLQDFKRRIQFVQNSMR